MGKLLIFISLFMTMVLYGNHDTLSINSIGFQNIIIHKTTIKDVIGLYGNGYKFKENEYTWAIANTGSGCIHLRKTKRFYKYKKVGITFITTENDTISGIIFTRKAKVRTPQNLDLKRLRKNKIESIINSDIALLKDSRFYINRKNMYGYSQKYSKRTNRYSSINGILYCYRTYTKLKVVNKKILEIRIGD